MYQFMERPMFKIVSLLLFSYALSIIAAQPSGAAPGSLNVNHFAKNVVVGELKKFDAATKTAVVKLSDGTEEVFKVSEKTVVQGVEGGAKMAALAGKEGSQFVIHYTEKGSEKTAESFKYIGSEAHKVAGGTVTKIDKAGHTVAVKTADGSEEVFHLSKDCVVDTGKGIAEGSEAAGKAVKDGGAVTVHYTEDAGKKVAHVIKVAF
jgi:hypothetical protein